MQPRWDHNPSCGVWGTKGPLPWNDYTCFVIVPHSGLGWTPLEGSVHISGVRTVIIIIAAISNLAPSMGQATCFAYAVSTALRGSFANFALVAVGP